MINEYYYKKGFICVFLLCSWRDVNCHITMHSYGKKSPVEDTPGIGQAATKKNKLECTFVSKIFYQNGNDRQFI